MRIMLTRKMSFHLMQTYVPSTIFVTLAWLSIFIPPEQVPGKNTTSAWLLRQATCSFQTGKCVLSQCPKEICILRLQYSNNTLLTPLCERICLCILQSYISRRRVVVPFSFGSILNCIVLLWHTTYQAIVVGKVVNIMQFVKFQPKFFLERLCNSGHPRGWWVGFHAFIASAGFFFTLVAV